MSIFTPPSTLTSTQKFTAGMASLIQGTFTIFSENMISMYHSIWQNQDQVNLSPDKSWAALGTNAVQYRSAYLAAASFINANHPGLLPDEPAGWIVTNNQDGSITAVAA